MNYEYLENGAELHKRFSDRFVMTFDEFKAKYEDSDWIRNWISYSHFSIVQIYQNSHLWDLFSDWKPVPFEDALSQLNRRNQRVIAMCERDNCFGNSDKIAISADSAELAERIHYEWYTTYELAEKMCCMENAILPGDIYVFDETFSWYITFTHEYPWDEDNEYWKERYCFTYGV